MDLWFEKAPELWVKTLEHLMLTGVSTGAAVIIGLPLGVWITRNTKLRGAVLSLSGVFQTIPSLAMLAFLLPFLGNRGETRPRSPDPLRHPAHRAQHLHRPGRGLSGSHRSRKGVGLCGPAAALDGGDPACPPHDRGGNPHRNGYRRGDCNAFRLHRGRRARGLHKSGIGPEQQRPDPPGSRSGRPSRPGAGFLDRDPGDPSPARQAHPRRKAKDPCLLSPPGRRQSWGVPVLWQGPGTGRLTPRGRRCASGPKT